MKIGNWTSVISFIVATAVVLGGSAGSASAADEWFVLSEQALKSVDQGTEIKSGGNRWKQDIKRMRFSVDGADVEFTKVILHWDNRPDQTITDIGVVKAGGQSTPRDAPLRKARLNSVTVQYKIVGSAPTAMLKVWGFD